MQITVYPNNEIRLVWGRLRSPRQADRNQNAREKSRPLDIPSQPSQTIRRKAFKRRKLSEKARHRILHHAGLFKDSDKDRQVFLTGTLPGGTNAAMDAFTHLAPLVVKLVQTYLPRAVGVDAAKLRYVWVWELQKRGALHMHLIVEAPTVAVADTVLSEWRDTWSSILKLAAKKARCDLFERRFGGSHKNNESVWQIHAEKVKKSVSRYLSKYQSKGSDGNPRWFPPRWYGISSALRRDYKGWIRSNTLKQFGFPAPDVTDRALRAVCEDLLKEFTVGHVSHKHGYETASGVDCFGYIREGVSLESVFEWVSGMVNIFGLVDSILSPVRLSQVDILRARRLMRDLRRELPSSIETELSILVGSETWNRLVTGLDVEPKDFCELYWNLEFIGNQRGYTIIDRPRWFSESTELLANYRASLPNSLGV